MFHVKHQNSSSNSRESALFSGPKPLAEAYLTPSRMLVALGGFALALIVTAIAAAALGSVHISLGRALAEPSSPDHAIFFASRLPRVLMGVFVGAALATVGAALQALVRNPLAEGGILGVSGAGAFGAILALIFLSRLQSA
jgi:iron complex transport system permease protein